MAVWPRAYTRPALVIFSSNNLIGPTDYSGLSDIILTDHGRQDLQVTPERIENAGRMVDGTYRSHFLAEKKTFALSWQDVPSRANNGGSTIYTADGFAGALDMIDFLEARSSTFYMKMAFDDSSSSGGPSLDPQLVFKVAVQSYTYNVRRRSPKFDMMDVDISLTEV